MKLRSLLTLIIIFASAHCGHAQIQSGLLINGGLGTIKSTLTPMIEEQIRTSDVNYKYNFSLGYRFRIVPAIAPVLFIDLDANIGFKSWNSEYRRSYKEPAVYAASSTYYFTSVTGSVNYPIYKGLSIGAGVEPTYYFRQEGEDSNKKFDIPVLAKAGYKFNKFELGLTYKLGLMNTIDSKYISSGKFRDLQVSVWIPF